METELVRFRLDPQVRARAEDVCASLGLELADVLRALVVRIARDGALPFEVGAEAPSPAADAAFHRYDERLWAPFRGQLDAEAALALLAGFVARCTLRIEEAAAASPPDAALVARLEAEREEARELRRSLDVTDDAAVAAVLEAYGPLVRAGGA